MAQAWHNSEVTDGSNQGDVWRGGFAQFFLRIEAQRERQQPVWVAMEGCNGYARPLDRHVRARGYRLLNINNLKLALQGTVPRARQDRCVGHPSDAGVVAAASPGALGQADRAGALYLGVTSLDNTSGQHQGAKTARQINRRAKAALMNAVDHHRRAVPTSRTYYEKKRAQGRTHNQAIRDTVPRPHPPFL